ncbi:MAG: hypothetical protein NTX56_11765, partial [Proteobacteria bacterium]|nr:hypothetical protein [Pseudomonadota bacterium]
MRDFIETANLDLAHRHCLQCTRFVAELPRSQSAQSQQLARNVEAGDLHSAVPSRDIGFDRAAAQRINIIKRLAGTKQHLSPPVDLLALDDAIEQRQIGLLQTKRQAELINPAVVAANRLASRLLGKILQRNIEFSHGLRGLRDLLGGAVPSARFARTAGSESATCGNSVSRYLPLLTAAASFSSVCLCSSSTILS